MKKFLAVLLVIALCVSTLFTLVACGGPSEPEGPTLEQAFEYFKSVYKDDENKKTQKDYNLVAKVQIEGVSFEVSYTVDTDKITITLDAKTGFYVVDLPDENDKELTYTITATIKDAEGNSSQYTMKRILAVYEAGITGVVTEPVANTAYKLFMEQNNIGKVLFITAEASGDKFLKTNIDPKVAPDWYVEAVDGGYKIYTVVSEVKMYMLATASPRAGEEGKFDKVIALSADNATVFKYKADINAWYTTINTSTTDVANNIDFAMGTYSTYDTLCISEISHYTAENTGVEQFPLQFITKEAGEAMNPTEGPADPTELTSIADVIAIGVAKDSNTYTVEKYLVEGVITSIANSTYGNLYIEDAEGNSIYIYGLYSADGQTRFDKLENKPMVGDTIRVMSIVGQYNGTAQLKNAWLISKTDKVWTDAEKVAYEKDNLNVIKIINVAGNTVLPVAGTTHSDVVVAWEIVGTTTLATMTDGKTVVVAALPTEAGSITVKATFTLGTETATQEFTITISTPETLTVAEAIEKSNEYSKGNYSTSKYFVEGVITSITSTKYGNMYIEDGEGNSILIYGLYNVDGSVRYDAMTDQPQVGDTIKVLSVVGMYDAPQLKDAWLVSKTDKVWTDAEKVAYEKDNLEVINTINVAGETVLPVAGATHSDVVVSWEIVGTTTLATMTDGKTVVVAALPTEAGSITVKATFTLGTETATKEYTVAISAPATLTIPEAVEMGTAKDHNTYTDGKYFVEGVITNITGTQYGNMYIEDGEGNSILIYGLYSADGSVRYDAMDNKPQVGDTIKVLSVVGQFNGTAQLKNAWLITLTKGENPDPTPDPEPSEIESIANIIAGTEGAHKAQGTVIAINARSFLLKDDTGIILVFMGKAPEVAVGDTLTLTGTTSTYGGMVQFGSDSTWTKGNATTVTHPNPIVLDAAGVDRYSTNLKVDYVQITGNLAVSGNYFNLNVEGATLVGSLTYLPDDLKTAATALDGSGAVVKGYVTGISGSSTKYLNLMVTEVSAAEGGDPTPEPTPDPEPSEIESIANIIAGTEGAHKAQGTVIAINARSFLLKDNTGIILVYMGDAPEVAVGDTLTLTGTTSTYGGMVQFGSDSTWTKGNATTVTHPNPIVLDAAGVDGYSTNLKVDYVQITGNLAVSGNYFNLNVEGATLVGSLTYLPDDLKTAATALNGSGAVVKGYVTGISGSNAQYLNLMVTEVSAAEGGDPTPEPEPVEATLAEAAELADGTLVIVSGAVCKINYAWSDSNGNMSVTITDGTNELYVYKLASNVALGDLVTITGAVGSYNGAKQIAEGATATVDGQHSCDNYYAPATCTKPATCKVCGATNGEALGHGEADEDGNCPVCGESVSATTSEMTIAASTGTLAADKLSISWTNGTFTVTNEKNSSTTAIRTEDTDHFRVYAKSKLVIAANGANISKVVITAISGSYATALADSLNAVEGYTAVVDGKTVTLTLSTPATEIACVVSAQTRINNVEVTYVAG